MGRKIIGRYAMFDEIARGGMASIHLARLTAAAGFSRTVVVKRMQPELAQDPQFCAMFMDEARLAARIHHPNVAQTLDVISEGGELLLVLEYVSGTALASALRAAALAEKKVPIAVANAILVGTLRGLHAAHTATNERGEPLHVVHRDVSPQNILVGTDGVPRLIDFGVAKAVGRLQTTDAGSLRGKLAYMPPEQIVGTVSPATDLYAAGVVLWEAWTGRRFFEAENEAALVLRIMDGTRTRPSTLRPDVSPALEELVMRAVAREPADRFASAEEMATSLEHVGPVASPSEISAWLREVAGDALARRAAAVAAIEADTVSTPDISLLSRGAIPVSVEEEQPPHLGEDSLTATYAPSSEPMPVNGAGSSPSRKGFSVAATRTRGSSKLLWVGGLLGLGLGAAGLVVVGTRPSPSHVQPTDAVPGPLEPRPVDASTSALSVTPPAPSSTDERRGDPSVRPSPSGGTPAKLGATVTNRGAITRPLAAPLTSAAPAVTIAPASAGTPAPQCDPPYDIDPVTGDKRYRRECLRR